VGAAAPLIRTEVTAAVTVVPTTALVTTQANTQDQGLTLVHFSAKLERFAWDRGCLGGFRGL